MSYYYETCKVFIDNNVKSCSFLSKKKTAALHDYTFI